MGSTVFCNCEQSISKRRLNTDLFNIARDFAHFKHLTLKNSKNTTKTHKINTNCLNYPKPGKSLVWNRSKIRRIRLSCLGKTYYIISSVDYIICNYYNSQFCIGGDTHCWLCFWECAQETGSKFWTICFLFESICNSLFCDDYPIGIMTP